MFPLIFDLRKIEEIRKKLGLTQKQLAKLAGVSQSIIAKIENGKINPSYEMVRRIVLALERYRAERGGGLTAKDICTRDVKYVQVDDELVKAIELMRKYDISQLPVFDRDKPVGSISETTITRKLDKITSPRVKVKQLMDEAFPILPEEASVSLVREVLMEYPAVLIQKNGEVTGIITKADILKVVEKIK